MMASGLLTNTLSSSTIWLGHEWLIRSMYNNFTHRVYFRCCQPTPCWRCCSDVTYYHHTVRRRRAGARKVVGFGRILVRVNAIPISVASLQSLSSSGITKCIPASVARYTKSKRFERRFNNLTYAARQYIAESAAFDTEIANTLRAMVSVQRLWGTGGSELFTGSSDKHGFHSESQTTKHTDMRFFEPGHLGIQSLCIPFRPSPCFRELASFQRTSRSLSYHTEHWLTRLDSASFDEPRSKTLPWPSSSCKKVPDWKRRSQAAQRSPVVAGAVVQ